MKLKIVTLILTLFVISCSQLTSATGETSSQNHKKTTIVESCIAEFCFGNKSKRLMKEEELVKKYGGGKHVEIPCIDDKSKVCRNLHQYYVSEQNLWVEFEIHHGDPIVISAFVTQRKLCDKKHTPKTPFKKLATSHGIKIGDTLDKVKKTYREAYSMMLPTVNEKNGFVLYRDKNGKTEKYNIKGAGDPQKNWKYWKYGYTVLTYPTEKDDELLSAEFFFKEGVLDAILISGEE